MKKNIPLLALVLLLFTGCVPVIKIIYGIRKPSVEDAKSILKAARKYKLDKSGIVTTAPDDFITVLKMINGSIPEGQIFDNKGEYIEYRATDTSCNAGLFPFISYLSKNGVFRKTGVTTLATVMKSLRKPGGGPLPANFLDPNADYYLFIYWTIYTGRSNKNHVKAWERLAANNHKAKIQVIAVNMDFQQWWPHEKLDSILKKLNKK